MSEYIIQINEFVDVLFTYGPAWVYLLIFAACFIENIVPPFPGDSFIVVAGGLVAAARLDPIWAMLSVISGGLASVMVWYFASRRLGRSYILEKNFKMFTAADLEAVEARFERHGGWLLVFSRFVVGMRVLLVIASGLGRYPVGRMVAHTALSYFLFGGLLMYVGFALVENIERVDYYFKTYSYVVWPIVVVLILVFVISRVRKIKNRNRA